MIQIEHLIALACRPFTDIPPAHARIHASVHVHAAPLLLPIPLTVRRGVHEPRVDFYTPMIDVHARLLVYHSPRNNNPPSPFFVDLPPTRIPVYLYPLPGTKGGGERRTRRRERDRDAFLARGCNSGEDGERSGSEKRDDRGRRFKVCCEVIPT